MYRNEEEVGIALKESGLSRKEVWITTKWSGMDGKGCRQSCEESLSKIGIDYIDLYLIHSVSVCQGDIERAEGDGGFGKGGFGQVDWGLQVGRSLLLLLLPFRLLSTRACRIELMSLCTSFTVDNLKELLASCSVKPVVNQILLHPYVIRQTVPLLEYMAEQHIVPEGYSTLIPLTSKPGGPVDKPVEKIAERLGVKPEQVLLAWSKAKR